MDIQKLTVIRIPLSLVLGVTLSISAFSQDMSRYCDTVILIDERIILAEVTNYSESQLMLNFCEEEKRIIIDKKNVKAIVGDKSNFLDPPKPKKSKEKASNAEKKNAIYVIGGVFPPFFAAGSINYERKVSPGPIRMRVGFGGLATYGLESAFFNASTVFLAGKRKNYFEANIGMVIFSDEIFNTEVLPSGVLGYRYAGNRFLFRTGIAIPEAAFVSFGFAF